MTAPSSFIVSVDRNGARLSAPGFWGNIPFTDQHDAEREARRIGGDAARIVVEPGRVPRLTTLAGRV